MSPILYIIILLVLGSYVLGGILAAPWIPTSRKDVERFLDIAQIKPGQMLIELGCGDGRIAFAAASHGAYVEAYEISILPYLIAKIRSLFSKHRDKVKIHFGNFWNKDLSKADYIYAFLMHPANKKLCDKLKKEAKRGAKLITYTFKVGDLKPLKICDLKNRSKIYLYQL